MNQLFTELRIERIKKCHQIFFNKFLQNKILIVITSSNLFNLLFSITNASVIVKVGHYCFDILVSHAIFIFDIPINEKSYIRKNLILLFSK